MSGAYVGHFPGRPEGREAVVDIVKYCVIEFFWGRSENHTFSSTLNESAYHIIRGRIRGRSASGILLSSTNWCDQPMTE